MCVVFVPTPFNFLARLCGCTPVMLYLTLSNNFVTDHKPLAWLLAGCRVESQLVYDLAYCTQFYSVATALEITTWIFEVLAWFEVALI
jgi:hypothetical protein